MNKINNIVFYFGAIIIIAFFVILVIKRFKEDDKIDLKEHKWIIITYIVLMIMGIIIWRIIDLMIESKIKQIITYNKIIEKFSNGKE